MFPNPAGHDRRASTSGKKRDSLTGGPRKTMHHVTVPLVGRVSNQDGEKSEDILPVGAYPKGMLDNMEADAMVSLDESESRNISPSNESDTPVHGRQMSLNVDDQHRVPLATNYANGSKKQSRASTDSRRQSEARKQSMQEGQDNRRQSMHKGSDNRKQSIHQGTDHRRLSTLHGPDLKKQSPRQGPDNRKQSMHLSSTADDQTSRRGSTSYAAERTTASSFLKDTKHGETNPPSGDAHARRRTSSYATNQQPEHRTPSQTSIGKAEDVDMLSDSLTASTVRSIAEARGYKFQSRLEHFVIFAVYSMGFNNLWAIAYFSDATSDTPSIVHHIIAYVCIAMPILYMEMFIGQYTNRGLLMFGRIIPLAYGYGWAVLLVVMFDTIDTTMSMGDSLFYFIVSFAGTPWMDCSNPDDKTCLGRDMLQKCKTGQAELHPECSNPKLEFSAILFLREYVVMSPMDDTPMGGVRIARLVCSLLSWIMVSGTALMGFTQYKRILEMGLILVVSFFSIIMVMLMATHGEVFLGSIIRLFGLPENSLTSPRAWTTAIISSLMGANVCQAGHVLFGTYMTQKSQADLQAIIFTIACGVANLVGAIFSHSVYQILHQGYTLTNSFRMDMGKWSLFTVIPQGIGVLEVTQLLSILYFFLLFIMIYQNQVVQLDIIVETIIDAVPKTSQYRKYMVSLFGVAGFLISIVYVTGVGFQLQRQLERNKLMYVYIVLTLVLTMSVFWLYGTQKFSDDIHFMVGEQPPLFWKMCWRIIPAVLFFSLIYCPVRGKDALDNDEMLVAVDVIAIILCVLDISPVIIGGIYKCLKYLQYHNLVGVLKPENDWGHPDAHERLMRRIYNPRHETRFRRRDTTCKHRCLKGSTVLAELIMREEQAAAYLDIKRAGTFRSTKSSI